MADLPRRGELGRQGDPEPPVRSVRAAPPDAGQDLRGALVVVWRRKWSIIAVTLALVGIALFVSSRQAPVYASETRVLVVPVTDVDNVPIQQLNLATEAELIQSVAVAEIVAEELGIDSPPRSLLGNLSVEQPTDTEIIEIGYSNPDPAVAQRQADAFAEAYLQFRTETATETILAAAENIQDQISELVTELNEVNRRLEELSETNPNRSVLEVQANTLSAQITPLQLRLLSLPDEVTPGRIIQPAPFPTEPVSPNHLINGGFGLVAGLALGVVLAFLRDRLSERLRSTEEAEAYLEAPILASIPRVSAWRRRREAFLVTAVQWRSPAAEAYRVLRTNILSAAEAMGANTIAVTSAYAGEGKSTTTANLAVVLARAGKRVTLVSADLRRPRLHDFFKREGEPGLIEVLAGRATLDETLQTVLLPGRAFDGGGANIRLLPSGRVPEDATELIASQMMSKVIDELERESDIVLIDLPPVLPLTDALVVAAETKYVLVVIGPKADNRQTVTAARQQLDRVGARIIGGVFNGPSDSTGHSYYSY
jgi:capsular exopolysaccharide synthesis family protein